MTHTKTKGFKRVLNATIFSMHGFRAAWSGEEAFRQEVFLSLVFIPLGLFLGDSPSEKALLALSCFVIMITELLNSAIEATVDRVGSEIHPLSKQAKDIGSAAVFMSILATLIVWFVIIFL